MSLNCHDYGTGFSPLWCLGPRLGRVLCPREVWMRTEMVHPSRKMGSAASRVLRSELPAMSAPLHMVSVSRARCHFGSGILHKHRWNFFRTFEQWVGVIRIWKKKKGEYSVLRQYCFGNVRVYLHKARWLGSQVVEFLWNPHHVCGPLLVAMLVHDRWCTSQ